MTAERVIERLEALLGQRLQSLRRPSIHRVFLEVEAEAIPDASRILLEEFQARFQTASGVDGPREIEILYHWAFDELGMVVTVRTRVDRRQAEMPSIAVFCPAAEWIEREMRELLGISFRDHPDPRHLLLLDDWPEGAYPLRRDYRKE